MSGASPVASLRALATAAVIGSERSGSGEAPAKVLARAGVLGLQARAGKRARKVTGRVVACPVDPRPVAGSAPMGTLLRLLSNPDAGLITEWAELANARGVRVADAAVPQVLDWWARQPQRPVAVFHALGQRGEWLAALNPAWKKPVATQEVPANAAEVWETGTGPERAAVLASVRRADAARALEMVQSTWKTDGADDRVRFLNVLEEGLSGTDEAFLETALDDRAKSVRQCAVGLLAQLPGSKLRARMAERLAAMVCVERKKGGILRRETVTVEVEPPKDFDPSWERDGIDAKPPQGKGARAWWLQQIVSATDPMEWCRLAGLTPEELREKLASSDSFKEIEAGWFHACVRSPSAEWVEMLATVYLERIHAGHAPAGYCSYEPLWQRLPRHDIEAIAIKVLKNDAMRSDDRFACAGAVPAPWGEVFSRRVMEALAAGAFKFRAVYFVRGGSLGLIAELIHPAVARAYEAWLLGVAPKAAEDQMARGEFPKVLDRLRLRVDMHKEFAS
ncbi:MAG TPA: DUF5691 domain-containing protein [Phycisphaerales bacterium]|nr:DUF5691 domain-containing protein [Phycisphaerales bacterium]